MSAYEVHLRDVQAACDRALEVAAEQGDGFDAIVFHAGSLAAYHADDLAVPFRAHAHFLRFAPVAGPGHLVVHRPGERTILLRAVASGFWYEPPARVEDDVRSWIDVIESDDVAAAFAQLQGLGRAAFIGEDRVFAQALGFDAACIEPASLLAALDWERALKTDYEIDCIREAQRIAARGHVALRGLLENRATEFELHLAYQAATQQADAELPYPSIIAWDQAAAVLHYQHRRTQLPHPARSFLVDAGACYRGYASDITRTYHLSPASSPTFEALLNAMEALQLQLADRVRAGVDFVDLHRSAEIELASLLRETGILRTSIEQARAKRIVFAFFPHGLGHHLGLQAHDVGAGQIDPRGTLRPPPDDCPHLRTTRVLAARHVVTIEPGLYFIPSLLDPLRGGHELDWGLVDALIPYGGIRIEDDILVTDGAPDNLTRPFVRGHR